MKNSKALLGLLMGSTALVAASSAATGQELVASDRIGLSDAPNEIVFRVNATHSNNHPQPTFAEGFTRLYEAFARNHPDWQIEIQVFTGNIGQEHARLLEQAKAGRAPACSEVDSFQLPLFISQGVLQPLNDFFSTEEIDDLFPFIRSGITGPDGKIYAWWWNTDLRLIYRDTEVVPEGPETWDELKEAALQAAAQGKEGFLFNGGRWEGTTFDWLAHFWSQGGSLLDDTGKPIFFEGENREYMLNAINFYKDLVDSGATPQRVTTITAYDDFNAAAIGGTAAMFLGGHWQNAQLREAMDADTYAKWGISPIPGRTPDEQATGTGGWTIASFSNNPEEVQLCMDLVREVYFGQANDVIQQVPTSASLFDGSDTFNSPFFQEMKNYLEFGRARPGFPIYPEVSNQIQIMMGEVLSGAKEPEVALDDAAERVMDAFEKL